MTSVVLENDRLRAVFLPEWGGRLWDLFDTSVPICRWTNAAVLESEHSPVLAPADSVVASSSEGGIPRVPVATGTSATTNVTDWTRPWEHFRARDFSFDIAPKQRPWILAADRDGDGLAMPSSSELRGCKLIVWGRGACGKRWQRWLTPCGGEYPEIRAGLAQTQFPHLEMPAGVEWTWVEACGNAQLSPLLAHGTHWPSAVAHAGERIATALERARRSRCGLRGLLLSPGHDATCRWRS